MEEIEYRDIKGWPGYRVGDDGSVWSCKTRRGSYCYENGRHWHRLKVCLSGKKNLATVTLSAGRRGVRRFYVSRLVLEAFVGPCPEGMEACHFPDKHTHNNNRNNLRWDTRKGNMADQIAHETRVHGSRHYAAKLNEGVVQNIRAEYAKGGIKQKDIAKKHGVDKATICYVLKRSTWKHVL